MANGSTGPDAPHSRRALFAAAACIAAVMISRPGLAAGVYRWVDEQGGVHYGDRPPSEKESTHIDIEPAPTPAPEDSERRAKSQRLLEALESERNRDKQKAAQAKEEKARRDRNCQRARRQAALYQRANAMFRRGPDGERIYLSDEEREQALAQTRSLVDHWCD
jgi:type IV secretory pathway VirB10-like protein